MRRIIPINGDWQFYKEGQAAENVNLPHTWNNLDGQDGGSDFYRGACRYERSLPELNLRPGERVYAEFLGVNSIADVSVNGTPVVHHAGGFSTFRAEITEQLAPGGVLSVVADNTANDFTYPQFADFTFYGGVYREVNLVVVPESHISLDDFGGPGVRVHACIAEDGAGLVEAEALITKPAAGMRVRMTLLDASGNPVCEAETEAGRARVTLSVKNPHLWDGVKDPYLYTLRTALLLGAEEIDAVSLSVGLRSFSVDPERGFFLNGRPYPLHGVSRHQDRQDKGWAISPADHEQDMALIAEVGANTVRLAHYQHAQYFYDLCDRYGMVVWAEIPYISQHLEKGRENTVSQMTELVVQNMHHASVVCWGLSNEITMNGVTEDLIENHRILNELCHRLDPTRKTTMACVSMLETDSPLLEIPDILSYNHYFGWYGGDVSDNGPWLDAFHREHPDTCLGLSEYGCEGVLSWHTDKPKMGDYSEEYQAYYHEEMLKTFSERPYLWSTHVWNMFDFGSDMRDEGGVKGRNNKGLVTYDRGTRKDSFYLYKAWWSDEPFVHIAGKRFVNRPGRTAQVCVYSNQPHVSLYVNNKLFAEQDGAHVFRFEAPLRLLGRTKIAAVAGDCRDEAALRFVRRPDPAYSMDSAPGTVTNWFDKDGKPAELLYPEGYFSIRDSIEDILNNEQGRALFESVLAGMAEQMGAKVTMNEQTMKMVRGFTVERIVKMAGKRIEPHQVVSLNEALNRIKKN